MQNLKEENIISDVQSYFSGNFKEYTGSMDKLAQAAGKYRSKLLKMSDEDKMKFLSKKTNIKNELMLKTILKRLQ